MKFSTGGVTLQGGTLADGNSSGGLSVEVTNSSDTATVSTTLSGINGLTKSGAGTLTLGGTQSSLTGTITVGAGVLQTSTAALANNNNVINNGTFAFIQNTNGHYSGTLTNNGTFTKDGTGNVTFDNAVSGSGSTTISGGGTLTLGANQAISSGAVNMTSGTTLDFASHNASITGLTVQGSTVTLGTGTLTLGSTGISATTGTSTVSGGSVAIGAAQSFNTVGDLNVSSALTGASFKLSKTGAGTLTLSGNNSGFTNTINLGSSNSATNFGTIAITNNNSLGGTEFDFNSGTLSVANTISTPMTANFSIGGRATGTPVISGADLTVGNLSFFKSGTTSTLNLNVNNNTTIAGTFGASAGSGTATGGIVFGGTGTLTFGGSSTSAVIDPITISNTLTARVTNSAAGALGTGALTVNSGATLDLRSSATLGNALTLNGGTLSLGLASISQSFGTLNLGTNSTINFSNLAGSLSFADSHSITWSGTLTITNYNSSTDSLHFGNSANGLTSAQLSSLIFANYGNVGGMINASGLVSAIPEPSTYAAILGGVALIGVMICRRKQQKVA